MRWALSVLGRPDRSTEPYRMALSFGKRDPLPPDQKAVLERLSGGDLGVLSDTLIGSTQRVEALLRSGSLALLPDFNHIGVDASLLARGAKDDIRALSACALESTIFDTELTSFAVLSAPSTWGRRVLSEGVRLGVSVSPVVSTWSSHGLLRHEPTVPGTWTGLLWE